MEDLVRNSFVWWWQKNRTFTMARYSAKNFYFFTILIMASFASFTAGLSLEELSLEMQQLKQNNEMLIQHQKENNDELRLEIQKLRQNDAIKVTQFQELLEKIQHLETKLKKLEKDNRQTSSTALSGAAKETSSFIEKQADLMRNAIFRTCKELHQADPSLNSGMYWIDPDGQGVGDDPIYVHCDMITGKTAVLHDSEDPTNVGHCADPGCYSRPIKYSASMRQMDALAELSSECHQSIRYDCNLAPFETNDVAQSWWNDRNGVAQYFWSGSNNSVHTCQCGIDKNCVEPYYLCNCDSAVPIPLNDTGVITDKKYLPITRLNFGRTQLETSSGVHTLGRFECSGQVSVSGMPKSCSDLWKIGHTLSGVYSVMGSDYVETLYCDFTRLPHEQGFQTWIGYSDVKSLPVYFYVQKNTSRNVTGTVPFELTRHNIGGAMDASSGIFTAPRSGIYSFAFTGLGVHPTSTNNVTKLRIALMLNDSEVGRILDEHWYSDLLFNPISLNSALELKAGDQVSIRIIEALNGAYLIDNAQQFTHFTGQFLQEYLTSTSV